MVTVWRRMPAMMQEALTLYALSIVLAGVIGGLVGGSLHHR